MKKNEKQKINFKCEECGKTRIVFRVGNWLNKKYKCYSCLLKGLNF
jgi:predicted RNA-binding Zn-ribbon protein involved in translation (DUF1610 family)